MGLQLEYLLMLQNFREVTHGAFDWILYHITLLGEYCFAMLLIALFYWVLNKKCGIYLIWNFFGALVVNQFLKVTACIYRPWILDNRIHPRIFKKLLVCSYASRCCCFNDCGCWTFICDI